MAVDEDTAPQEYPYAWSSDSELSVLEFVAKYKPSMVQDDGTKPWLWIKKSAPTKEDTDVDAAVEEAGTYLEEVTERIERIKNDDSIPTRANKKKGIKSKKELREELQNEATEKFKQISIKHGYVSGKWLIFAPADRVDLIWSSVAKSLIEGPLAETCVHLMKVATSPKNETPNYQHVLCLYMPNVYDKDSVTEVMHVLLRKHGLNLMGVKSNLYTSIGLDSKHASGIQSTIWRNTALMKDSQIKELKDAYFAELNAQKPQAVEQTEKPEKVAEGSTATAKASTKPKLKRKAAADDPFASDGEDEDKEKNSINESKKAAGETKKPASKASKPPAKKRKARNEEEDFASDKDSEEEERKKTLQKKKAASTSKAVPKKQAAEDDFESYKDSEEDERKKQLAKRKATSSKAKPPSKSATAKVDGEDEETETKPKKRTTRSTRK